MKHARSPDDDDEERLDHTARRVQRLIEQPLSWGDMLPELQNEVLWIMQRRAQRGDAEWTTALAMLRRTALREWHRHVPPLPEDAVGLGTTIPKIASIAAMLAAPLRAGDWPLFQELVVWRKAMGKPVNLSVSFRGNNMAPVHQALGYQSNPDLFERFVALAGAGTMRYEKEFLSAVIQGVCERGTNTTWFKELVTTISRSVPFQEISSVARHCARYGRLGWLRYLHENGSPWDAQTCASAAKGGHLDCLRYARENGCPWDEETCASASSDGHLDCLRYVRENGCPWDAQTSARAAQGGHLDCVRYAHENGCPWDVLACAWAAQAGHLDCLRYAHENQCPWDVGTCMAAAEGGHRDCLRYAHENGCPWDKWTCTLAAEGGHLDCLRYAHENGCPWDEGTCAWAAKGGHLDCLRYAHENQCPWDTWTCASAAGGGHLDCLRYVIEHRCPMPWREAKDLSPDYTPEIREYLTMLF